MRTQLKFECALEREPRLVRSPGLGEGLTSFPSANGIMGHDPLAAPDKIRRSFANPHHGCTGDIVRPRVTIQHPIANNLEKNI